MPWAMSGMYYPLGLFDIDLLYCGSIPGRGEGWKFLHGGHSEAGMGPKDAVGGACITEVPHQSRSRTKTRFGASHHHHKMRDIYAKTIAINKAVAAIQRGEFVHYANAAEHYECSSSAVSRRIRGLTKSKKDANSIWHQCLTIEQEELLIHRINVITDRSMPPTSHIVRNLVEEIRGKQVGKNWVGQFVKRHGIRLKSLYLRNIDNLRAGAEYAPMF
jgi:hypothetical protein